MREASVIGDRSINLGPQSQPQVERASLPHTDQRRLHIICERDVGLFSLIQQVIANIPWAVSEGRIPVVYFGQRTCYWNPNGYGDRDTVWEYYFDPIVPEHPVSSIPVDVLAAIESRPPGMFEIGCEIGDGAIASANFGDHPALRTKCLQIPYLYDDPDGELRRVASALIRAYVRPRDWIAEKADCFYRDMLSGRYVIGVNIRGTDAVSPGERRPFRKGSLRLPRFRQEIRKHMATHPDARIFIATDDERSLAYMRRAFGDRVVAYGSIRHTGGGAAGRGPTGMLMPAYVAGDRDVASRNGEEAIIESLLLGRCQHLIHNGSSLARTVLLSEPDLPHTNTHRRPTPFRRSLERLLSLAWLRGHPHVSAAGPAPAEYKVR